MIRPPDFSWPSAEGSPPGGCWSCYVVGSYPIGENALRMGNSSFVQASFTSVTTALVMPRNGRITRVTLRPRQQGAPSSATASIYLDRTGPAVESIVKATASDTAVHYDFSLAMFLAGQTVTLTINSLIGITDLWATMLAEWS